MAFRCKLVMFIYVQCFLASDVLTTDPCPANIDEEIFVTMCENNVATEHTADGGIIVDNVVLRVAKQRDNCVCSIEIAYQAGKDDTFYLQKYNELAASVPSVSNCGLEIDITSNAFTQTLEPITCLGSHQKRMFYSPDGYKFYLTSRKTKGTFQYGYCLQFFRNSTQTTPAILRIECLDPSVNSITAAYPIKDHVSKSVQNSSKQSTNTEELITEQTGITNKKVSVSTSPSAGNISHMENRKDTVLLPLAIVGWIVVAILLIFIILDKSRRMVEKRKEERNNTRLNYEIPNCLRRESANYSDLDHIEI